MIGGFILSDGLGLGSKPTDIWPKIMTTVVLLTGMGVALLVLQADFDPVPAIIAAQGGNAMAMYTTGNPCAPVMPDEGVHNTHGPTVFRGRRASC